MIYGKMPISYFMRKAFSNLKLKEIEEVSITSADYLWKNGIGQVKKLLVNSRVTLDETLDYLKHLSFDLRPLEIFLGFGSDFDYYMNCYL